MYHRIVYSLHLLHVLTGLFAILFSAWTLISLHAFHPPPLLLHVPCPNRAYAVSHLMNDMYLTLDTITYHDHIIVKDNVCDNVLRLWEPPGFFGTQPPLIRYRTELSTRMESTSWWGSKH